MVSLTKVLLTTQNIIVLSEPHDRSGRCGGTFGMLLWVERLYFLTKPVSPWNLWWWNQVLEETNVTFSWSSDVPRLAHSAFQGYPTAFFLVFSSRTYRTYCERCGKSWQARREGLTWLRNWLPHSEPIKFPQFCRRQEVSCGWLQTVSGVGAHRENEISSSATVVVSSICHIYQGNQIWQLKCPMPVHCVLSASL